MGKSSSQTIGYWYHPAFHMGLGYGPGDALLEIRGGDKTAWSGELTASGTITVNAPNLWGGEKDRGGMAGAVDVMFGEATQQPNAYLTATFGNQQSGWRGFMTVVWKGGRYGAMNPYPQKISYKWRKIKKGWDGDPGDGSACWYPEKAEVVLASDTTLPADATGWEYQILPYSDNPGYNNLDIPTSGWSEDGQGPFSSNTSDVPAGNVTWPQDTILWTRRSVTVQGNGAQTLTVQVENGCVVFVNGAIAGAVDRSNENIVGNQNNTFTFPVQAGQTYEIAVKAFDEHPTQGGTYLSISIAAPGLTAMNPAHILYYARTQQHMGREPTANMNDASFKAAADWFYAQGFGLCTTYDASQEAIDAFVERIEKVAGCSMTRSPSDGLWYLDVTNGEYTLDDLPVLTDDDILAFTMQPATLDSAVNSVSVQFFDPQQKTTVSTRPVEALALVSAYGRSHQDTSYPEIPTSDLALRVAQRDLQSTATPTHGFEITTTRIAHSWRKGTYFRMQAPKHGVADMVCIVGDPDSGTLTSGAIKLTCVEDIYSVPATSFMQQETGVDTRPSPIPLAIMTQAAFEAPYIEVVRNLSRADLAALPSDAGYLMTVAKDPATSRDYTVSVSTDAGATYADADRATWCPSALIVEGDALENAAPATEFTIAGGTLLSSIVVGSAAMWDSEDGSREVCRVDAIDAVANTLQLGRGCADTVPGVHAANSRIWFYDGFAGHDTTEYTDGETIDIELLTNTGSAQLDRSLATPLSLTFNQRQARPYPSANVKVNDLWYPNTATKPVTVTFNHRDRVSQADQLVDYSAESVGPETGVTYTLRGYVGGTLTDTIDDQTASPITWNPSAGGSAHIELVAVRGGIESNVWSHDFTISGNQPWTPANLATPSQIWLNDTSAVTDDGTGMCSQWNDISGNARNFVQGTSGQRPAIINAGQNNRRMLTFDGVDDWLSGTATCAALTNNIAALSIFVVGNPTTAATFKRILNFSIGASAGSSSARAELGINQNSFDAAQRRADSNGAANAFIAQSDNAWRIIQSEHDWTAATVAARLDGGAATTTNTGQGSGNTSATNSNKVEMGGTVDVGGQCLASSIAEVIVLGYVPSDSDRQMIEGYLAYRWGLQGNLPADHPYKSAPPTI